MAAGSIVIDLILKTGSFEQDTARAQKSIRQFKQEADDLGKKLGVAAVAGAVGLAALVKSVIDSNDHLNDLSKKTGIAVDTLGGIGFAAEKAGGDLDTAALALGKFNQTIAKAAAGDKEAGSFFKALGLNLRDASGNIKSTDALLSEAADKFSTYEDGANKTALAVRGFGKAGADLIPLLDDGGKALSANIAYFKRYSGVTQETASRADEFNDTLSSIKLLSKAFGQTLTAELLPPLQNLADLWLENKEKGDQFKSVATDIADVLKGIATFGAYVALTFSETGNQLGALGARAAAVARGDFASFSTIGEEAAKHLAETRKNFEDLVAAINGSKAKRALTTKELLFGDTGYGSTTITPKKKQAPGLPVADTGKLSEFDKLMKDITGSTAALADETLRLRYAEEPLNEAQKKSIELAAQYQAGQTKLTKSEYARAQAALAVKAAQEQALETEKKIQQAFAEGTEQNASFVQSLRDRRDALEQEAKDAQQSVIDLGKTREEIEAGAIARERDKQAAVARLAVLTQEIDPDVAAAYRDQAKALGVILDARQKILDTNLAQQNDPFVGATQAVQDYLKEISKAGEATNRVVGDALRSVEQIGVDVLQGKNIKQQAKALVDQLIAEFLRLQLIRPLMQSIFGGGGGGGGSIAGLLGTLGSLASGSYDSNYSHEGRTAAPPSSKISGGLSKLGGTSVVVEDHSGTKASVQETQQGDKKLIRVVVGEVARSAARGGVMRTAIRSSASPAGTAPRRG